jgi:protein O-GlcNAc transferase
MTMRAAILLLTMGTCAYAWDCPAASANPQQDERQVRQSGQVAREAFRRGDYARAAKGFRQALCLAPDNADLHHGLGLAEAAAGNFEAALRELERADQLSPRDFGILLSRAQVEISAGNLENAVGKVGQAEMVAPASGRDAIGKLHAQLGGALLQQRKLDLALAQLLRATRAGQRDASTVLSLSALENNLGAYSEAAREAATLDHDAQATTAQRAAAAAIAGLAYKNQKKSEDAIRCLKHAIELAPSEIAYMALAEIYQTSERSPEAAKLLEQGVAVMPVSQKIAEAFGRSLVEAGSNERAVAFLQKLTQAQPDHAEGWRWLAQAQSSLGQFQKATGSLKQLAARKPDYPMIDLMIAQSLLKWDPPQHEQALSYLERAARTSATDADVFYLLGKVYYSMGRYEAAVQPLQHAIELGPSVSTTYYQLGQVLQKLGREAEAREQFEKMKYLRESAP